MSLRLLLVRHAQTPAFKNGYRQQDSSRLEVDGKHQAQLLAQRLVYMPLDALLSSPITRAVETAQFIADSCGLFLNTIPLLTEMRKPSANGLPRNSKNDLIFKNGRREAIAKADTNWKNGPHDESFGDVIKRAIETKHWFERLNEDHVVAVSHSNLIAAILTIMIHGDNVSPHTFFKSFVGFYPHFTGITTLNFERNRWRLITFNDYSHLTR